MAEVKVPQIYGLIGEAMKKIRAIGKSSTAKNASGKEMYKFRGIDAVYNALNPIMSELGLFIIPEVLDKAREERKTTTGATLIYSILTIKFTMYAPDGSNVSGVLVGEGMDSGDKASNKAMSIAMKYFAFQTFMIPTEDVQDPDAEVHEVAPKSEPPVKAFQRPAAPAKAVVEKKDNSVISYIKNEKAFMAERLGITTLQMNARFADMRKSLIDGKVIEEIPSDRMTMEQARQMIDAIYANFFTDKKDDGKK